MRLVERLRKPREMQGGLPVGECYGCYDLERKEAADEIERLLKIEVEAKKLTFGAYPAHGSGFVTIVTGGNITDLTTALKYE